MARCPAGICPFDPFQLHFMCILRSKEKTTNACARREDKGSMRKDRPSWQRMKLCALRCDIDDSDPMMLAAPAFTASRLRLLHPRSTAHHFSADILICMICSWTARTPLKGRRRDRRSCKTPLTVNTLTCNPHRCTEADQYRPKMQTC